MNHGQTLRVIDRELDRLARKTNRFQRLFDRYNRRFFGGQLSGWTVGCSDADRAKCGDKFAGFCDPDAKRISLNTEPWISSWEVRRIIVHEMAHAATSDMEHWSGGRWCEEMERLRRAGAPAEDPARYVRALWREFR
jgi:hypothetical protein